jgi:acyl-CoA hydrolase
VDRPCVLVFVALDPDGQPTQVPAWRPETPFDAALAAWAARLAQLCKQMDSEIEQGLGAVVSPP